MGAKSFLAKINIEGVVVVIILILILILILIVFVVRQANPAVV